MKKSFLIAIAILFVAAFAYAEETSQAQWNKDLGSLGNNLREKATGHTHEYTDNDTIYQDNDVTPDYGYGAGVDLVVYESDPDRTGAKKLIPDAVEVQTKWDFANENGATYVVAKYNIWELLTKKR